MVTYKTAVQRYEEKLRPQPDGCIGWGASIDKYGNAKFSYTETDGRKHDTSGHKFGWELAHGAVPFGMKLKNTCKLKSCQEMTHWTLVGDGKGLTLQQRYEARYTRLGPDECWPWQEDSRDKNGYGLFSYRNGSEKVTLRATRFGWDLLHPDDPALPGELICHTCDNPPCNNPAHWFKGSNADNMADMAIKGRATGPGSGEDHPKAKLTWEAVDAIRSEYASGGISHQELADRYGVNRSAVSKVIRNQSWVR